MWCFIIPCFHIHSIMTCILELLFMHQSNNCFVQACWYMHVCTCVYVCSVCAFICMYAHVRARACARVCICVCAHSWVYITPITAMWSPCWSSLCIIELIVSVPSTSMEKEGSAVSQNEVYDCCANVTGWCCSSPFPCCPRGKPQGLDTGFFKSCLFNYTGWFFFYTPCIPVHSVRIRKEESGR